MIISRPQGGYQLLTPLTECLCCGSNVLQRYLDLGMQPPPNAFNDGSIEPKKFPLETFVCCNCYHSQLGIAVSPNVLFSKYSYRTGVSVTLKAHYEELASQAVEYTNNKACSVLDIGCNDGTLLSAFKKLGLQTYGVDPCKVPDCSPDIDVFIEDYWRPRVIDSIINYKRFDIITGTNVLAHNSNPKEFLRCARQVISDDGIIVLEFPYAWDMLYKCEFDTIYHEHISYFTCTSFSALIRGLGLYVDDFMIVNIHGGSLRLYIKKCEVGTEDVRNCREFKIRKEFEQFSGLGRRQLYEGFQCKVDQIKGWVREIIDQVSGTSMKVVGFGASGKGTIFLNYCKVNLAYIVDETPAKIGKYSPYNQTRIVGPDIARQDPDNLCFVIMAWNCMNECISKICNIRSGRERDMVLTYLPEVRLSQLTELLSRSLQ